MSNAADLGKLFSPIRIGSMELKNRIAFAPTGMGTARADGSISDQGICHYAARAKGGAGLIIVEHSVCTLRHWKAGVPIVSFHNANCLVAARDLADAIHACDAKAVVQLSLGLGRQANPKAAGTQLVGASSLPYVVPKGSTPRGLRHLEGVTGATPRELSADEVLELEEDFVSAAARIKKAGFEGIEIHGAHGYLLADFISPLTNKRTDAYGGSFEKRLTLPMNLIRKTRKRLGDTFILGFRVSGDEHVEGGLVLTETLQVVQALAHAGLDYIHLSSGRQEALKNLFPDSEGVILPEAEAVKKVVGIPVLCPNIHDPNRAEEIVATGRVDVLSMSRGLLADPEWPNKVRGGRTGEIRRCIFCNSCLKSLWEGLGARCAVNPDVGHERFMPEYFPFAKGR